MRALLTILICAFVAACAHKPAEPPPARVQIPRDCENLAERVEGPVWHKGDNAKVLLGGTAIALEQANDNIDATRQCQARQRETLAQPSRVSE